MATKKRLSRAEKRQIVIDTNFANKDEFSQELFCDYTILTFKVNYRDKIGYSLVIFEKRDVKLYRLWSVKLKKEETMTESSLNNLMRCSAYLAHGGIPTNPLPFSALQI